MVSCWRGGGWGMTAIAAFARVITHENPDGDAESGGDGRSDHHYATPAKGFHGQPQRHASDDTADYPHEQRHAGDQGKLLRPKPARSQFEHGNEGDSHRSADQQATGIGPENGRGKGKQCRTECCNAGANGEQAARPQRSAMMPVGICITT